MGDRFQSVTEEIATVRSSLIGSQPQRPAGSSYLSKSRHSSLAHNRSVATAMSRCGPGPSSAECRDHSPRPRSPRRSRSATLETNSLSLSDTVQLLPGRCQCRRSECGYRYGLLPAHTASPDSAAPPGTARTMSPIRRSTPTYHSDPSAAMSFLKGR
jgi:hypothetical protein